MSTILLTMFSIFTYLYLFFSNFYLYLSKHTAVGSLNCRPKSFQGSECRAQDGAELQGDQGEARAAAPCRGWERPT